MDVGGDSNEFSEKVMIQPQPVKWKQAAKQVSQRSRRMMLTIRADKDAPFTLKHAPNAPPVSMYKHLEMNIFPIQIDLTLVCEYILCNCFDLFSFLELN